MLIGYERASFWGFGVETSIMKDVARGRAHRNIRANIACSFANSDLSVWYLIHLIYTRVVTCHSVWPSSRFICDWHLYLSTDFRNLHSRVIQWNIVIVWQEHPWWHSYFHGFPQYRANTTDLPQWLAAGQYFLRILQFPPPIKLTTHDITETLVNVALNTIIPPSLNLSALSVHDEGCSWNAPCTLNLMFKFLLGNLLIQFK